MCKHRFEANINPTRAHSIYLKVIFKAIYFSNDVFASELLKQCCEIHTFAYGHVYLIFRCLRTLIWSINTKSTKFLPGTVRGCT